MTPETTHVGIDPKVVVLTPVSLADSPAETDAGTWLIVVVSYVTVVVPLSVIVVGT